MQINRVLAPIAVASLVACAWADAPRTDLSPPDPAIRAAELTDHVEALTSDAMNGRATGSSGEKRAADYIAGVFERTGLEPAGDDRWFQDFEFPAAVSLGPENSLRIADADLGSVDRDWRPLSFSRSGESGPAPVVFVGYGLLVAGPESYDSYAGLDVSGKWVVLLRFSPEGVPDDRRLALRRFASLRYKATVARDRGALGMLVVAGPHSKVRDPLVALAGDASNTPMTLYAASISPAIAEQLLGRDLGELQAALDGGDSVPGFEVPHVALEARVELKTERRTGRNVLARLRGTGGSDLAPVVVGAHYDHLGRGTASSLGERGKIHRGADDNASGVAAVLEIAGALAPDPPSRDVIFAAWSGEESGLLGSNHFVKDLPAFDFHSDPSSKRDIAAYLNLDMVGRLREHLVVYGVGSSPVWPRELETGNAGAELPLELEENSYVPSDATSFYLKGVPSLTTFTGAHAEYHTPDDTADLLDYEGMRKVATLVRDLARSLGSSGELPEYVAAESPESSGPRRAFLRAWLGTIPDYAPGEAPGLPLSGVMKNGPAAEAGLRGGDVIVELAGRRVENIYDYTYAIESLRVGETVGVTVLRDGERLGFEVTPRSRQ